MCENNNATEGRLVSLQISVPLRLVQEPGPVGAHSLMWNPTTNYLTGRKLRDQLSHALTLQASQRQKAGSSSAEIYLHLFQLQFIYILKKAKNIWGVPLTFPSHLCGRAITCHSKRNFKTRQVRFFFWQRSGRLVPLFGNCPPQPSSNLQDDVIGDWARSGTSSTSGDMTQAHGTLRRLTRSMQWLHHPRSFRHERL